MVGDGEYRELGSINRRHFAAGLTAGAVGMTVGWMPARAASPDLLFAGTALADNPLARRFRRFEVALPDIPVITARGPASLAGVGGKARLLSLWAEWCVPCLVEIRDFAKLRPQVVNDRFDIGLLGLGGDRNRALAKLRDFGAQDMPLLIDPKGESGYALATPPDAKKMAGQARPGFTLPCTLLVTAEGRIKGRMFGSPDNSSGNTAGQAKPGDQQPKSGAPGKAAKKGVALTQADKDAMLAHGTTGWASREGLAFLDALHDGILDRV